MFENRLENSREQPYSYIGFAPHYSSENNYKSLKSAENNVQNIANLLGGQSYIGDIATKDNFIKNTSKYESFQLAMHVILDDKNPLNSKLIFTKNSDKVDSELYAYELYNMKIPAELGVLSACKTGTGLHADGEGIMSLSRAFTYAGCHSLLMSL